MGTKKLTTKENLKIAHGCLKELKLELYLATNDFKNAKERVKNIKDGIAKIKKELIKKGYGEGICPICGELRKPIYENNGHIEPEGPSHWEITGFEPCDCGRENA